jgi:hypothetical protein
MKKSNHVKAPAQSLVLSKADLAKATGGRGGGGGTTPPPTPPAG